MLILGLESSCDETAAALVTDDGRVLAHRLLGQEAAHAPFGGVVPEIAARACRGDGAAGRCRLCRCGVTLADVDAIAATAGPGLIGGVMVGLVTGKALAHAAGKPLIAVNHLEGHALSPRLSDRELAYPYLLLLVSGGHCQLLLVEGWGVIGGWRRRSTMRRARRSTRPPSCSASAILAARVSRRRRGRGTPCSAAAAAVEGLGRAAFLLCRAQECGGAGDRPSLARGYCRLLPAGGGRLPARPDAACAGQCAARHGSGRRGESRRTA